MQKCSDGVAQHFHLSVRSRVVHAEMTYMDAHAEWTDHVAMCVVLIAGVAVGVQIFRFVDIRNSDKTFVDLLAWCRAYSSEKQPQDFP